MSTAVVGKGLAGVVAANSGICWIDGDAGVLAYRGIDIHELAELSTFEETTYLLWFGQLPRPAELKDFSKRLLASWIPRSSTCCGRSPRARPRWKCCAPRFRH
jgi:citrate synthase